MSLFTSLTDITDPPDTDDSVNFSPRADVFCSELESFVEEVRGLQVELQRMVGAFDVITSFAAWASGTTYSEGDVVIYTDGHIYRSIQDNNLAQTPTNRTAWMRLTNTIDRIYDHGLAATTLQMGTISNNFDTHKFRCQAGALSVAAAGMEYGRTIMLIIEDGGLATFTWFSGYTVRWAGGVAPTFTADGIDRVLVNRVNGTIFDLALIGLDFK